MNRALTVLVVATILGLPTSAYAHAIGVECKLKDGKILVEAFYDDDSPAIKAKVELVGAKGKVFADGITDKDGRCSFPAPDAGEYEVRVDAGAGHRTQTKITIKSDRTLDVATPGKNDGNNSSQQISTGQSREEFTETPWLKLGIGLGMIVLLTVAALTAFAFRKQPVVTNASKSDALADLPSFPGTKDA